MIDRSLDLPSRFPITATPEALTVRWHIPYPSGGLTELAPFTIYEVSGAHILPDGRIAVAVIAPSIDNPKVIAVSSFDGAFVTMDAPFVAWVSDSDRDAGTILGVDTSGIFQHDEGGGFVSLGLSLPSIVPIPSWCTSQVYGGEKTVTLVMRRDRGAQHAICFKTQSGAGITGRSGSIFGGGTVDIYDYTGTDTGIDVFVYNNSTNTVATSKYGVAVLGQDGKYYVVSAEGYTP